MSLPLANGYLFMWPSFIIGTWGSKLRNLGDWSWPTWPPPIVDLLTHWPLGDLTIILHIWFSHSFYWLTPWLVHVKLLSVECHRPHWHCANIDLGMGLLPSVRSFRAIYTCIIRYCYEYSWCIACNFFKCCIYATCNWSSLFLQIAWHQTTCKITRISPCFKSYLYFA